MNFPVIHRSVRAWRQAIAWGALLGMAGCGGSPDMATLPVQPVRGNVTFRGQPIADAQLWFYFRSGEEEPSLRPLATTDAEGNYRVTTYREHDGAPLGEYAVTVSWKGPLVGLKEETIDAAPPELLPPRYQDPDRSGLSIKVALGMENLPPFDLKP